MANTITTNIPINANVKKITEKTAAETFEEIGLQATETEFLNGATAGTGVASKALVLNAAGGTSAPGALTMFGAAVYTTQISAITTAAVSALTTTGVASLSTEQNFNLTTTQLTALCANNDLLVPAVLKVETDLNAIRAALQQVGITA